MTRILIIDDDDNVRTSLRMALEDANYEIVEASDGESGLKRFREDPTDLVITDIIMPEKEGIELISDLRKEFPDVKIIAISGGGRAGNNIYLNTSLTLGAMKTFSKPIDLEEFLGAIEELVG